MISFHDFDCTSQITNVLHHIIGSVVRVRVNVEINF
jgi:hypothetical protein